MSTPWTFAMDAGTNETITVTVSGVDLTGGSATYRVRRGGPGGPIVFAKTEAAGITLADGSLTITLAPSDTAHLHGDFWHSVQATTAGAVKQVTNHGTIAIRSRGV